MTNANKEEIIADANGFLTVTYLRLLHPELTEEQAMSLLKYCKENTIRHKECYGDGSIMLPKWKAYINS